METITRNQSPKVRQATLHGRDYLVAPLTLYLPIEYRVSGVYGILNEKTGKVYVGSSVSIRSRIEGHRRALRLGNHANRHLQRSFFRYGEGAFLVVALEECPADRCVQREQYWIDLFNSASPTYGYNLCPRAESSLGVKRSEETRARLSSAMQGWKPSIEMLEAARKVNTGRKCPKSLDHRLKISLAHRGKKLSAAHAEALRRSNIGRSPSAATREKLSSAARNRSPETRLKLSVSLRNRSDESLRRQAKATAASNRLRIWADTSKSKLRSANLGKRHSAEARLKMSLQRKGRKVSDEVRQRMSEAAKLRWLRTRQAGATAC